MKLHSYSSIYAVGHRAAQGILDGPVIVEEKVDGSQITFGVIDGDLAIRSKGAEIFPEAPEKMFAAGVAAIVAVKDRLTPGLHYRGEYLQKPKHNTLAYDRIPTNHIVIFDVDDGQGTFLDRAAKEAEAARLGFDIIPELHRGRIEGFDAFTALLATQSYLGGVQIEGVVIKPERYDIFGQDKKVLMAKFVRDEFKEMNQKEFRGANPTKSDVIQSLGQSLRNEARWQKAIQHLREQGVIEGSPRDIGHLIKEVPADIQKECSEEIKEALFRWAWPQIKRIATAGLPEWYRESLAREAFGNEPTEAA